MGKLALLFPKFTWGRCLRTTGANLSQTDALAPVVDKTSPYWKPKCDALQYGGKNIQIAHEAHIFIHNIVNVYIVKSHLELEWLSRHASI